MTTSRTRALVSLAATMTMAVALGACALAPARGGLAGPLPAEGPPLAIRFDNDVRDYVHVYLVGERREWLLGRVEPGAVATLRIPAAALAEAPGLLRLAVIPGGRAMLRAARDPRARLTIAQPVSAILSQEWWFAQGQLSSHRLRRPRAGGGRR